MQLIDVTKLNVTQIFLYIPTEHRGAVKKACVKACTSQDFISAAGVSTTAAIMCDCFHLALPNWHAASSGTVERWVCLQSAGGVFEDVIIDAVRLLCSSSTVSLMLCVLKQRLKGRKKDWASGDAQGAGRRLRAPEPGTEDDSTCDEPSQFTERERPRPQGSSPVEEYPETEKYTDSDKECEAEHDPHHKSGSGKKSKKSGLGSMFEKRSTPKMSKLKEDHSPESGVMVKTAQDGCSEGLVYGGGGREGIFIKEVVPESPASNLKLKEGDRILSATVYFDNMSYEDAIQILEHAQAYKVKLCLKRTPVITETEPVTESDVIPEEDVYAPEMRENGKTKRRSDARISWPKFPSFGKGKKKSRFSRSHSSSEAEEQRKLELSPTTSDTESPIKSQDALKSKKKHKIKLPLLSKRGRISSSEDQDTDAPTTAQLVSPETLESPSGETPQVYETEELKVFEDLRWEEKEPKTVQHKVELITIDSTLKTEDLTLALAGEESSSGVKSPDGKKKKKERSELKMKILGKDKSHKKDAKATSSPKRLKTLGAIPTFGAATSKISVDKPDVDIQIDGATVDVKAPSIDTEDLSVDIKAKESDIDRESKFKMPKFGISMPRVKGPELDSSLSTKDLEVTLPKAKAEINLASVEITQPRVEIKAPEIKVATKDKEGSPSKFKMPTFKLPTFGVNIPSATVEVSEKDKDIRIDGADITIPEEVLAVHITAPSVDTEDPSIVIKTERKESKFKLPSLGFSGPQIKQPDLDLGLEKKDMPVTLPAKAEVNLPDVGLKEPLAQVDIKGPQIKMGAKEGNVEEPAKTVEKEEQKDVKSPVGETSDEEISPTSSVQSSDAFADISSAMTSEHLGLSLSSPTKVVTVKFSDPNIASGLAKGLPLEPEAYKAASWTVEDPESGKRTYQHQCDEAAEDGDLPALRHWISLHTGFTEKSLNNKNPSPDGGKVHYSDNQRHTSSPWMTEVMNSLEPGTEDFSGGGAAADQGAIFPDTHERYPKLSKRLPSIVVEPTDGAEVESGELRWPPDEPSSPDGKTERKRAEEQTADEYQSNVDVDEEASAAEMQD
ncbi:hypothetical protein NQZ68_033293 [Dissostichus eleginoides]|nr:hypothetical protein NQZ68_033293 [Dissostichus eleginoides]